jgi:hypothetical protein
MDDKHQDQRLTQIKVKLFYEGHPHQKFYKDLVNNEVKRKIESDSGLNIRFSPNGPIIGKILEATPEENGVAMVAEINENYIELFKNPWVASYGKGKEEDGFVSEFEMFDLFIGPCRPVERVWEVKEGENVK